MQSFAAGTQWREILTDTLLSNRPFLLFWTARVFSAIAFQVSAVAVGWQVYALTGSAFNLGMLGLVQFLPMVVLTLAAGHAADRYDRRAIVRTCQAVMGCSALMLAMGNFFGWLHIAGIFSAVAVIGAARSFEHPTMSALLPGLVPDSAPTESGSSEQFGGSDRIYHRARPGWISLRSRAHRRIFDGRLAFPLGKSALLFHSLRPRPAQLEFAGLPLPFFRNCLHSRPTGNPRGYIPRPFRRPVRWGHCSASDLRPRHSPHGSMGFGSAAFGAVCRRLAMSVFLARFPLEHRIGHLMFGAVIVFGFATMTFALSTSMILSLGALVVLGSADVISIVIRTTLVQLSTPDEMRGRVSAVNSLFVGTSNQLGEFESGVTAALLGTVPAVVVGGLGTIVVAILWMRLFPDLRRADSFEGRKS